MRILFTSPVLEFPPAGGPQLRIANSIKILAQLAEVHVVSRQSKIGLGGEAGEAVLRRLVAHLEYSPSATPVWRRSTGRLGKLIQKFSRAIHRADLAHLVACYDRLRPDIVWLGYGNISHSLITGLRRKRPSARIVCDTDSVWSRFLTRGVEHQDSMFKKACMRLHAWRKEREERVWVRICNAVTAVSEVDAAFYRSLGGPPEKVMQFSNVIDPDFYRDEPARPAGLSHPCVYLAGTFGKDSPMEMATRWVLDLVWPRVLREVPEARLCIVGRGSKESLADVTSPEVLITGRVDSVLPYLKHADVCLVPLSFESGTRFKILEAGVCRKPMVSTVLGAEGIAIRHGQEILLADDPADYAQAIVKLLRETEFANVLGANCQRLIEEDYSLKAGVREARAIVAQVMS